MWQAGYQPGSEPRWWWKVAQCIDEAQAALVNAMGHNLDDPRPVVALEERLREAQVILLGIFQRKGFVATPAKIVVQGAPMEVPQPPAVEMTPSWPGAEPSTESVSSMEAEPSISVVASPESSPAVPLEDPLTGMSEVPV